MIGTDPAFTEFVRNVLQFIPRVSYQLLPAETQPTDVTRLKISVKTIFQAVSHTKIPAVASHTRRVAAGFLVAEVSIKPRGQGIFPRHIPNIADFQVFSNEKITRINIPGSFSQTRYQACGVWRCRDKDGIYPGKSSRYTEDYSPPRSVLSVKKTVSG